MCVRCIVVIFFFFFFKQKTAYEMRISDWSSDVCSSDLMKPVEALALWQNVVLETVRRDGPDLSSRQLAILLTVYLTPPPHTVRGLAASLKVSKPAITRALDTLGQLDLLKRQPDDADRRNVLVQRTVKGQVFPRDFGDLVAGAAGGLAAC